MQGSSFAEGRGGEGEGVKLWAIFPAYSFATTAVPQPADQSHKSYAAECCLLSAKREKNGSYCRIKTRNFFSTDHRGV
jgi:hypothetical protein